MKSARQSIEAVWRSLFLGREVQAGAALAGLQRLLSAWSGRGRHYHDLRHLEALLHWAHVLEDRLQDPAAVRWAIFYHDAVYRPRRKDNEQASADLARKDMRAFGMPESLVEKVADMILRTQHHDGEGADGDTQLLLDMDLAILGAERTAYVEYASNVRREYRWVPAPLYRKGRAEVLQSFLKRDRIYFSDYFFQRLEAQARENLQAELTALTWR